MKKKLQYPELKNCIGKSTFLQLHWRDWKNEQPKIGQRIYVVVQLPTGYLPKTGVYLGGVLSKTPWHQIKFDTCGLPELFLGSKDTRRVIAWAIPDPVEPILNEDSGPLTKTKK
jgi:hypothetical protein